MNIFKTLYNRIKEPSSWAGLSALAIMFGVPVGFIPVIGKIGAAVLAVGAILIPEQPAPKA